MTERMTLDLDAIRREAEESAPLRLWTNGYETYVARDVNHVLTLWRAQCGYDYADEHSEPWEEDDRTELTVCLEDEATLTLSASGWIKRNGPGMLCSTEW